jgi:hypothetical protein
MFIAKKHISRRTFLRGAGVTIALPFLESMVPAQTPINKVAENLKTRFVGIWAPHGWAPLFWNGTMEGANKSVKGADFNLGPIHLPLEPFKDKLIVFGGLDGTSSMPPPGSSGGDHSRGAAFLTGAPPKKTAGADIFIGTSIDQLIAQKYGQDTLLPSIQLGIEDPGSNTGVCGWGYSCAYSNSVSWAAPNRPLPHQVNPLVVFERLFGDGSTSEQRSIRKQRNLSIIDSVGRKVARLQTNLPSDDRHRLNNYLEDIREIERRLQIAAKRSSEAPSLEVPFGVPESFDDHIKLMYDLQALAFQGDITRVSTLMYARDVSLRSYPESGVTTVYHSSSHHGEDPKRREDYARINAYHQLTFGYFLKKLQSTPEGDSNLLDRTLILWGSNMGNANQHSHVNVGHLFAGGASLGLKGGRYISAFGNPTSNLLLTTLHLMGIEKESIGDSTSTISL